VRVFRLSLITMAVADGNCSVDCNPAGIGTVLPSLVTPANSHRVPVNALAPAEPLAPPPPLPLPLPTRSSPMYSRPERTRPRLLPPDAESQPIQHRTRVEALPDQPVRPPVGPPVDWSGRIRRIGPVRVTLSAGAVPVPTSSPVRTVGPSCDPSCRGQSAARRVHRRTCCTMPSLMRNYEVMVILDPNLEERTIAPSLDAFSLRRDQGRRDDRQGRQSGASGASPTRSTSTARASTPSSNWPPSPSPSWSSTGSSTSTNRCCGPRSCARTRGSRPWQAKPSSPSSANLTADPELRFTPSGAAVAVVHRRVDAAHARPRDERMEGRRGAVPALLDLAPGR